MGILICSETESGLTVCRADFITSKKGLGRWRKGDVPSHAAGDVPGGQAAAEQGKGWMMLLLGDASAGLQPAPRAEIAASASVGTAVPILQPYPHPPPPSSCGCGSLSSFVGKRSSFGYSPPPAISPYICHLCSFLLMIPNTELLPYK